MQNKVTDWNVYYSKPYVTASVTRHFTFEKLKYFISKYLPENINVLELGGANSCFYIPLIKAIRIRHYSIIDNNSLGLEKFRERIGENENVTLINSDILKENNNIDPKYDLVYSVGLIEHFSPDETSKAIKTHFDYLKEQGIVIITFPTPTFLYKLSRKLLEFLRLWIFFDERPLEFEEVINACEKFGEILYKGINWGTVLTQGIVVVRKR